MYIAPEIPGYAQKIIKSAIGTRAEIQSFRWADGGGLYNKVYCLDTNEGSFIIKIERDRIFPSTRKGQIENEEKGSRLLKQAEKLIEDYAHIRDRMAAGIERSKKDASREHITAFVEKCKSVSRQ